MANMISTLSQDIRYALRQLRRSPVFALTAVLTVALGIGANTAIFTLAHAVLLRQLPVADPKSLYRIGDVPDCCISGRTPPDQQYAMFSAETYQHLRDHLPEFSQLAAMSSNSGNGPSLARRTGSNDAALYIRSNYVSGNYFQMFGIAPERGRMLLPTDDQESATPVAVMSYRTWVNQFHSDPAIVGSGFLLDNRPISIVGIAPESFYGDRISNRTPDFYLPIFTESKLSDTAISKNPHLRWLYLIGRVQPGVNLAVLQQKTDTLLRGYLATQKDYQTADGIHDLQKVHAGLTGAANGIRQLQTRLSKGLGILLGISFLVLLIACANMANLLLARGLQRRAETSVRLAIGAARSRILRQALTESVALAFLGGALGVGLAFAGARAILALAFAETHNLSISTAPSLPVLLFTLAISLTTGILFGLAPAWSATRNQPVDALRGAARTTRGGSSLPQRSLVVLQATISLVLITVAALLTRSLSNLQHQDFGLQTENRVVLHMNPSASGYTPERYPGLMQQLSDRISAIPGTERVAFANYSPLEGNSWGENVLIEGHPDPDPKNNPSLSWDRVSPGFFNTVGQPMLRGRDFSTADRQNTPGAAIVNESFVNRFLPTEDPIGRRFGTEKGRFRYTIIGVVADAKYEDASVAMAPMFFRSILQPQAAPDPKDMGETVSLAPHTVMIRTAGVQAGYEAQIRRAVQDVDPGLAIIRLQSLDSQIAGELSDQRLIARLTAAFGILALLLASVGLYGVTAYAVAQRVPEIGLRMALGSDRSRIVTFILRGALSQTLIGLAIGVPLAMLAGHFLQSQLFGIGGQDALTLAEACGVLAISAIAASVVPARRAANIDPMQALRSE